GGNDELNGGDGNDRLEGRQGDDIANGNLGDDTYKFAGSVNLGDDDINENPPGGTDTTVDALDFSGLGAAVGIDIADAITNPQTVAVAPAPLKLNLSSATGLENVV